jgi:hypothetical protein
MFGKEEAVGNLSVMWEIATWKDAIEFCQIRNWKAPARNSEGWRKEIGEAMALKWAEAL